MKKLIAILLCTAACQLAQQNNGLGPDSQPQDGVPKGTVTRHVLPPGKFYPGTPHDYAVYVPAQYDASKPTPFMIYMDGLGAIGNQQRVPVVFDNLIAKHDIPPMIGIFINPGVLPMPSTESQNRFERIFEYDSQTGRFAEFLIDEVIPEVAKSYNLSKDPNDRGLAGVSTGAVAAFMAAWNRPDQFHRVLSFIGTYVSMRGADTLPALIRRTEPKPIRIHLEDGTQDHITPNQPFGSFYAGSWPINNQVMYEALQFAGYDVKLVMGDGGHNMQHGSVIMPDALRWLWRGYPEPIVVHEPKVMSEKEWDPRGQVFAIVSADKGWQQVGGSYQSASSPAADKDGNVFFADAAANRIYKSDGAGKVTVFKDGTSGATALRFAPDGRLVAAQPARKQIVSYGPSGDEKVLARNVTAHDLAVTKAGEIYFTDSAAKSVGLVDGKGQVRTVYSGGEIWLPTGLSLTPDQAILIVGDGQTRNSWSFQIAADGSLINGEPYFRLEMPEMSAYSGVDGITVDDTGQVFFATGRGIQVNEPIGRMAQILATPERGTVSSLAFGGPGMNWIYAAENNKLFRRETKRKGVTAWSPAKPPRPPL